jgi:UDP-N-acetylglucosamine transferase subunit ALG13
MDAISERTEEDVVIQIGNSEFKPRHASYFRFKGDDREIDRLTREARVVVCHSGVGTIMKGLEQGRALVVMPRKRALGEHVDDHQSEIAERLSQEGLLRVVDDAKDLDGILLGGNSIPLVEEWSPSDEKRKLIESLSVHIQSLRA